MKTTDPIVLQVIDKLDSRSAFGLAKYGVGLDRDDLTPMQWLQHMQEEMLDGANYAQRLLNICAEVRRQALEDAAQACEQHAGTVSMFATSKDAGTHNRAVKGCAAVIRGMKESR